MDFEGNTLLLTGPCNTFKYIRKDPDYNLNVIHNQINDMDRSRKISTNFTTHSWSQETGHILVCTDNGEMIICENSGDYKAFIMDAQPGTMIEAVVSLSNGFLVAQGQFFFIYRTSRVDDRAPLKLIGERCTLAINNEPSHQGGTNIIESMCVNSKENFVYVTTSQGQMIGGYLDCKAANGPPYSATFDYVQGLFHKNEITGLDVCIRKQLIVTCSRDKTVNIWDYNNRSLEIQTQFPEECLAVAFHPSGLHLVVAMQDKIQMCNVLSKSIVSFKSHPIKACTEIKFSHGGNMFACVANQKDIHVYNFYTSDCPPTMMFTGHVQRVRCIDWFENDLGFTTCCLGGNIYFYDLHQHQKNLKAIGVRNNEKDYNKKEVKFTSVVNVPGKPYEVLAVGSDKMITSNAVLKRGQKEMMPDDLPVVISQIVITPSGKSVITGVGAGAGETDRPGAI